MTAGTPAVAHVDPRTVSSALTGVSPVMPMWRASAKAVSGMDEGRQDVFRDPELFVNARVADEHARTCCLVRPLAPLPPLPPTGW